MIVFFFLCPQNQQLPIRRELSCGRETTAKWSTRPALTIVGCSLPSPERTWPAVTACLHPGKPPVSAVTLQTGLRLTQCQEKQEERRFHSKSNIDNKLFNITTDEGAPSVLFLSKLLHSLHCTIYCLNSLHFALFFIYKLPIALFNCCTLSICWM